MKAIDQEAIYFDSLALPTNPIIFNTFLITFPGMKRNNIAYQSLFSNNCAHFAICFVYYMCKGFSFNQFINILDNSNNANLFVVQFVNKMIGK